MNQTALNRCKNITKEVMEQPINVYFRKLKLKELPGYLDYVKKPMDLETINNNLNEGIYKTPGQWYTDMVLVYQNAMTYHRPDVIWHSIADYCLNSFKQKAHEIQTADVQKWYELLNKRLYKLTETIARSPIPQIVDPLVLSTIKKAETIPPPSTSTIPYFVEKINKLATDESCRRDIICILHDSQPDLKISDEKEEFSIDADSLSSTTLNALILYVNARG